MSRRLFELVTEDGLSLSPYVWRAKYALAHKGLPYQSCVVGFADIPRIGSGEFRTVPVLEDGGEWIADSWAIASHLDRAYPGSPPLFSSPGERAMVRFFDKWLAVEVMPNLFRICVLDIHNRLRVADRAYFRESREARLGRPLEAVHADRVGELAILDRRLDPMRLVLRKSAFLAGESAGYADFIAAGAFIWAGTVATVPLLKSDDPLLHWLGRCLDLYGGVGASLSLPGLACGDDPRPVHSGCRL